MDYLAILKSIRPKKRLGQNFLINSRIAELEASYGAGRCVLELGPGTGILTNELCKVAKSVIAVEKDPALYSLLESNMQCKKLKLIKGDFFKLDDKQIEGIEILIANIPYNLSSKVISWLSLHKIPALLCMQKEFVEHMLAKSNTRKYSKLSVIASLEFTIYKMMDVKAGNFFPRPKVDSTIVFIKPKASVPNAIGSIMKALMGHKKKKLKNAIIDARESLGINEEEALEISKLLPNGEERVFKMKPESIEKTAEAISRLLHGKSE